LAVFDINTKQLLVEYSFSNLIPQTISLLLDETYEIKDWIIDFQIINNVILINDYYYNQKILENTAYVVNDIRRFESPIFLMVIF